MDLIAPSNREKEIFNRALDCAAGSERTAFVERACAGDVALFERVRALLGAHEGNADFLPERSGDGLEIQAVTEKPGDRIGRYRLIEKIGEGGGGTVYVAEQEEPVRRRVALKVVKLGMDTREVVARFEAERQALALMDHPSIARVFDGGVTESGRPFFVMELVKGLAITAYCDEHHLSTPHRLDLFRKVCQAVQHAHQKGIIHRDLKPSNILVSQHDPDASGVPKVIDFGIAKAIGQRLTDKTLCTRFEQFLGTPAYMSPEQAGRSDSDIDTRSDIYSLGVLLYELLAGRPPFDPGQLAAGGLEGMLRCIREDEPPRPSTRLSRLRAEEQTTAARQRGTEPPKLIGQLRGDLDWIAMKCLEKDRARRYETANALALDLDRYLNHQPITARPPSRGYRVGKFVRRNRAMVTAAGAVVLALSLGIIGSVWQAREAIRARNQARQAGTLAQQQRDVALNAQRTTDQALRQLEIHRASELFRRNKAAEGLAALASMLRRDPTNREIAGWLVNELTQRSFPLPVLEAIRHDDIVHDARFSLDGTRILTVCRNNRACLWDGSTGLPVTPPFEHDRTVIQAGDYLEGLHPLHADLSADGAQVATASADGTARLWEIRTGQSIVLPHGSLVSWIRFSPDGGLVATACKDGKVRLWSVADGRPRGSPLSHADWVNSVEFSPDGRWLVSASDDNTAQVWAVPSGQKSGEPMRHARWVKHASFSPDGRRIVTASQDATARVWDAATGRPSSRPLVHGHIVATAAFSPDGRWVATASFDKTARSRCPSSMAATCAPSSSPPTHRSGPRPSPGNAPRPTAPASGCRC